MVFHWIKNWVNKGADVANKVAHTSPADAVKNVKNAAEAAGEKIRDVGNQVGKAIKDA